MPYSDKAVGYFRAAAAGKARKGDLSPSKAKELLSHEKGESQKKSLRTMRPEY